MNTCRGTVPRIACLVVVAPFCGCGGDASVSDGARQTSADTVATARSMATASAIPSRCLRLRREAGATIPRVFLIERAPNGTLVRHRLNGVTLALDSSLAFAEGSRTTRRRDRRGTAPTPAEVMDTSLRAGRWSQYGDSIELVYGAGPGEPLVSKQRRSGTLRGDTLILRMEAWGLGGEPFTREFVPATPSMCGEMPSRTPT